MKRKRPEDEDLDPTPAAGGPEEVDSSGPGAGGEGRGTRDDWNALDAELKDAKQRVDELKERYQRVLADQENARKRHLRDMDGARQFAIERFARDLLQVVDNLQRALAGVPADRASDPILEGVRMVESLLLQVLSSHGVTAIESLHQPFDPNLHEVVAQEPRADVAPNTVIDELVRGYRIGDRLLRAAVVRVSAAQGSRNPAADLETDGMRDGGSGTASED